MRTTTAGVVPKVIMTCNPNNPGSWWVYERIVSKLVSFQAKHVELFEKNVLLVSTLFDNSYLADPDSYIETLKASCNGGPKSRPRCSARGRRSAEHSSAAASARAEA